MPSLLPYNHEARIKKELEDIGVSKLGMVSMEAHYLPQVIDIDEHLGGVVYGLYSEGFAALIATDKKIIFLDKKPFFVNKDEITYGVVSGVSIEHAGVGSTVTLHTRIKDYKIRAYNQRSLQTFVSYIESHSLSYTHIQGTRI
jgi:hypothetical protein